MNEYLFDCTLTASIRVKAHTREEAEAKLFVNLDCASINAGAWDAGPDKGDPIFFEASLSGTPELVEVNGTAV